MTNLKPFFDACRKTVMGPTLDHDEVTGAEAILTAMAGLPVAYVAYALATAWHETAHSLQPIKEIGSARYFFRMYDLAGSRPHVAKRLGNTQSGDGVKFAGRGYVQLTGRANYKRAGEKLGKQFLRWPDMALKPKLAADIMRLGMLDGWFTGRRLAHYLPAVGPATREQFRKARRIINGTDKDRLIAGYALEFQAALLATPEVWAWR